MTAVLAGRKRGIKAEINVTPLVDVVFVLLIVFMVFTPLMAGAKQVRVPSAHGELRERPAGAAGALVISLTADRRHWLGNEPLHVRELVEQVRQRLKASPGQEVLLQADRDLSVADVRPLLQQLKDAGAQRIGFVVAEHRPRVDR